MNTKTKVKIISLSRNSYGVSVGDTGYVDGYVSGYDERPYAIVVIDRSFHYIPIENLLEL